MIKSQKYSNHDLYPVSSVIYLFFDSFIVRNKSKEFKK